MMNKKAVIIISGGCDSTTLLWKIVKETYTPEEVLAISFDYGQKQIKELDYAKWNCKQLGVEHKIIELKQFMKDFKSALTQDDIKVPNISEVLGEPQPVTYVPFRNQLFLTIACGIAESVNATEVYYGAQMHDMYCVPNTSNVVTDIGYKHVSNLKVGDKILSYDELNKLVEFDTVTKVKELVNDNLHSTCLEFTYGSNDKFGCSPNHGVGIVSVQRVSKNGKGLCDYKYSPLGYKPSEEININSDCIVRFRGNNSSLFKSVCPLSLDMIKLLGWYITEGCISYGAVSIGQSREKNNIKYNEIISCLNNLDIKPWLSKEEIGFSTNQYPEVIHTLHECGLSSHDKVIPLNIFDLSYEQALVLFHTMIKGDGNISDSGCYYYTVSTQLANQMYLLGGLLGYLPSFQVEDNIYTIYFGNGNHFTDGNLTLGSIKNVTTMDTSSFYYIETKKNHNFYCGTQGLNLHHNGYWDTTIEFIERLNSLISLNRKNQIKIVTPFVHYSKADTIREGLKLGVDYSKTRSCYESGDASCGHCPTCAERIKGFVDNKIKDPTEYENEPDWDTLLHTKI